MMRPSSGLVIVGVLLASGVAAAEAPAPARATNPLDDTRLICRKTAEVGSLVRKKKECYTLREWDTIAETHQRGAKKTFDGLTERSVSN